MDATAPATVLVAQGLAKTFKKVDAVRQVDVTVHAGERVGLLGPNGAGKTTTLLMLLGAVTPDRGTVTLAGHRLPKGRSAAMAHVGFAAGYLPLPEELTVVEVLDLFGRFYGVDNPGQVAVAALDRFGIAHLSNRLCRELSSGQRTLVGICKAILHRPSLLVLDEPTASLDPDVALRVRHGIAELSAELGVALLVTSHNMDEVEELCDRVVFLAAGEVVANDTPAAIAAHYGHGSLEEVFLQLAGNGDDAERSDGTEGDRK
jgi:ABC-2 type transport system ATP-binding protein